MNLWIELVQKWSSALLIESEKAYASLESSNLVTVLEGPDLSTHPRRSQVCFNTEDNTSVAYASLHIPSSTLNASRLNSLVYHNINNRNASRIAHQVYSTVLFPLSCCVVVSERSFTSFSNLACWIMQWTLSWPHEIFQPLPLLLVSTTNGDFNESALRREVAIQVLENLRRDSPQIPPTYQEAKRRVSLAFDQIQITRAGDIKALDKAKGIATRSFITRQENLWYQLARFRQVLRQAIVLVPAIRNTADSYAPRLMHDIVPISEAWQVQFSHVSNVDQPRLSLVLSSVFALHGYALSTNINSPEEVFSRLYHPQAQILEEVLKLPLFTQDVLKDFCSIVRTCSRQPKEVMKHHLSILKAHHSITKHLPYCNLCLHRTPQHKATCSHQFCSACMSFFLPKRWPTLTECPICLDNRDYGEVIHRPQTAGYRLLSISDGDISSLLKFLDRLRKLLYGHIGEYFDLVIGFGGASSIVEEYFGRGQSLAEIARAQKTKTWRAVKNLFEKPNSFLPAKYCHTATLRHGWIHSSYDLPREVTYRDTQTIQDFECEKLWHGELPLKLEMDIAKPQNPRVWASMLFASLFFIEYGPCDESSSEPTSFILHCRIPPGAHLQRIVMSLRQNSIHLHYKTLYASGKDMVCDAESWALFLHSNEFKKTFYVEPHLTATPIQFRIDSPFVPGEGDLIQGPRECPPDWKRKNGVGSADPIDACMAEICKEIEATFTILDSNLL